jgi:glycosyltransferase involved in cell wall biosynthesis
MLVSIIIPAHNEAALICRTLDSLRLQDYRGEMEIIVVDNNSTDETSELAKQWGARVVREERKGYVYALQRGFEEASGEILVLTDADTIIPQNWISTLVRTFDDDPQVVAAGGMVKFCDSNWRGRIFERWILPVALAYERICFSYPHLWGANLAVRKEAFLQAGGWDGKFNLQADTDLSRRLSRIGKLRMIRDLKVVTSARRFNKGLLSSLSIYGINFLSLQFFHRPIFFNFPSVRTVSGGPKRKRRFWIAKV